MVLVTQILVAWFWELSFMSIQYIHLYIYIYMSIYVSIYIYIFECTDNCFFLGWLVDLGSSRIL